VDQDTVTGIVVASLSIACFVLFFGMAGWWWRQRIRFARGPDPVLTCALRRPAPWGFGWRSGNLKLIADTMLWRGYWSFRATPQLVLPRDDLRFFSRTEASLQSSLAVLGGEVLHLEDPGGQLELTLLPHDAELFLEWLGVQAERPPRRFRRLVSVILWLGWLAGLGIYVAVTGERFFPLIVGIPVAVILVVGPLVTTWIGNRRARPEILKDEFVSQAREEFAFLRDFGFGDVWVRYLPWSVVVIFGASGRLVRLSLDRRRERLVIDMERRGRRPQTLRDLLLDSGHPDADRVTRYQGLDGPMRAALAANAHALRLWGRPFLTDSASGPTQS
jgi:hypothetical protein